MAARLARNYFFLAAAETAAKILNFLAFTYLGRTLGPERYGDLEFGLAAMLFLQRFVQLGLGPYGAREIAKQPSRAQSLLDELIGARLWAAAVGAVPMALFALLVPKSFEVKLLLAAYGGSILLTPALLPWFFQGLHAMHWVALASFARHLAFAAGVFFFFQVETAIYWAGAFEAASIVVEAAVCWGAARARGYRLRALRLDLRKAFEHVQVAAPIGLANFAHVGLWVLPLVLFGLLRDDALVGWFGAAHRATMAVHTFVWWYFFNLLPTMSGAVGKPAAEIQALTRRSMSWTAWGAFGCALGLALMGPELARLAYGAEFGEAGRLLAGLVWAIPAAAVGGHFRFLLVAYNEQRTLLAWTTLGAVASSGLTLLLTGVLDAVAPIVGIFAGVVLVAVLTYRTAVRRIAPFVVWRPLAAPAAAVALAGAPALWLADRPWAAGVLAGTLFTAQFAVAKRGELGARLRRLTGRPMPADSAPR